MPNCQAGSSSHDLRRMITVGNPCVSVPAWSWNDRSLAYYASLGSRIAVMERPIVGAGAKTLAVSKSGVCTDVGKVPTCAAFDSEPVAMAHDVVLCPRQDLNLTHVTAIRGAEGTVIRLPRRVEATLRYARIRPVLRRLVLFGNSGTGENSGIALWHEGRPSAGYVGEFASAFGVEFHHFRAARISPDSMGIQRPENQLAGSAFGAAGIPGRGRGGIRSMKQIGAGVGWHLSPGNARASPPPPQRSLAGPTAPRSGPRA